MRRLPLHLLLLGLMGSPVQVQAGDSVGADLFNKECAGCHGTAAIGGKDGEYPRLAGLPKGYIAQQLKDFRDRKRRNKPMLPIFKTGRLSTDQISALADHLNALPVPPPEQVGIPVTVEGDLEWGEELYVRDCALCHGLAGEGKPGTDNPPLRAQWPAYLKRQVGDFRREQRGHEYRDALFLEAEPEELEAVLAWLVQLNRQPSGE